MDEAMRKRILKSVKDYALDCIPKDATDVEIFSLLESLGFVFENAADHVRKVSEWWDF